MTRLSCTARTCVHNEGGLCEAENILVEGTDADTSTETFCSSFREDSIGEQFTAAVTNTNYMGELMQIFSSNDEIKMSPNVGCHAIRCFYNGNGKCEALDIAIRGDKASEPRETLCETFVE